MTQLRSLSLHLLFLPPPPGERIVLPALTRLRYGRTSKYFDTLAARIDAPTLGDVDITFFDQPTLDASQQFIGRTEMQTSLTRAVVQTSAHAISIFFTVIGSGQAPLCLFNCIYHASN
jgi:hypothetical protein